MTLAKELIKIQWLENSFIGMSFIIYLKIELILFPGMLFSLWFRSLLKYKHYTFLSHWGDFKQDALLNYHCTCTLIYMVGSAFE